MQILNARTLSHEPSHGFNDRNQTSKHTVTHTHPRSPTITKNGTTVQKPLPPDDQPQKWITPAPYLACCHALVGATGALERLSPVAGQCRRACAHCSRLDGAASIGHDSHRPERRKHPDVGHEREKHQASRAEEVEDDHDRRDGAVGRPSELRRAEALLIGREGMLEDLVPVTAWAVVGKRYASMLDIETGSG